MAGSGEKGRGASFAVMGTVLVGIVIVAILGALVMPYALGGSDRRDTRLVIPIDARTFPDAAWRSFVLSSYDLDGDGFLSSGEAGAVVHIGLYNKDTHEVGDQGVSGRGIKSLEGIEHFPNLEMLVAQNNAIEKLDLSGNPLLLYIDLRGNPRFELTYSPENKDAHVLVDEDALVTGAGLMEA